MNGILYSLLGVPELRAAAIKMVCNIVNIGLSSKGLETVKMIEKMMKKLFVNCCIAPLDCFKKEI